MMGGFFDFLRMAMGWISGTTAEAGGAVCATVTLAPRVIATVTLAPRVIATVTLEEC